MSITEETRVNIIKKDIETYRKFAAITPQIKEVIEKHNGKVVNKKLAENINAALNGGVVDRSELKFYVSTGFTRDYFTMRIICYDRHVKQYNGLYPDNAPNYDYYAIENNEMYYSFPLVSCFNETESGNYRIEADKIAEKLEEIALNLEEKAVDYEMQLDKIDEMIEERRKIEKLVSEFNNKYSRRITDIMGVSCRIENASPMGFKRYNIK